MRGIAGVFWRRLLERGVRSRCGVGGRVFHITQNRVEDISACSCRSSTDKFPSGDSQSLDPPLFRFRGNVVIIANSSAV